MLLIFALLVSRYGSQACVDCGSSWSSSVIVDLQFLASLEDAASKLKTYKAIAFVDLSLDAGEYAGKCFKYAISSRCHPRQKPFFLDEPAWHSERLFLDLTRAETLYERGAFETFISLQMRSPRLGYLSNAMTLSAASAMSWS